MASKYQELLDALCTGDVLRVPISTNLNGLRAQFQVFKKEIQSSGIPFNRTLRIKDYGDDSYYLVWLENHKTVPFTVLVGGKHEADTTEGS